MTPDFLQDARDPYPSGFRAILADPPYSEIDAEQYQPGAAVYPSPNLIVKRALDALPVGCRVGIIHYVWAAPPPDVPAKEIAAIALGTGRNGRARWFVVFEKLDAPIRKSGSGAARRKAKQNLEAPQLIIEPDLVDAD